MVFNRMEALKIRESSKLEHMKDLGRNSGTVLSQ
jgi:hypothetical protein